MTKDGDPRNIFLGENPRLIPLVRLNAASTVIGDVIAGTTTNNPSQDPLYTLHLKNNVPNVHLRKNIQLLKEELQKMC